MQCYPSKPASIVRIRLWRGITAGEGNIVAVSIASLGRHCGFDARFLQATERHPTTLTWVPDNTVAVVAKSLHIFRDHLFITWTEGDFIHGGHSTSHPNVVITFIQYQRLNTKLHLSD